MGWIMIITFSMVLRNLDEIISSPTGQPYIQVFYDVTQSYAGASVLSALVIVMAMFCNLSTQLRPPDSCLLSLAIAAFLLHDGSPTYRPAGLCP